MSKGIIVGIGEILWDMLPTGKALGGAPANFAWHASQCGFEACAVSAVGADAAGEEIMGTLRDKGLPCVIETVDRPTGTVDVTLDADGVPQYSIREDVAWDNIPFTTALERTARRCRAVCFGTLAQRSPRSHETIKRFWECVPVDAIRVFDINLRQHYYSREVIESSLAACDILKINDEEVAILTRLFACEYLSDEQFCRFLMEKYALKMVIETRGAMDSLVYSTNETSLIKTPRVEVVDTVGAGDSFTGVFIATLLGGGSVCEAHRRAVEVSAWVCTQPGAMPEVPQNLK